MDLQLVIDGKCIGSLPINPLKANNSGYLTSLSGQLQEEYEDIIDLCEDLSVEFFISGIPSQMNNFEPLVPPRKKNFE